MTRNKEPAMNIGANGGPLALFRRIRRFAARHRVCALFLLALPIAAAGFVPLLASRTTHGPDLIETVGITILVVSPTLLFGAVLWAPRFVRAVARLFTRRRDRYPQPTSPPIEELAADLRRLLWQHDTVGRSTDEVRRRETAGDADIPIIVGMRARRLRTLEGAITYRATLAARALDVPHPDTPAYGVLDKPRLSRLLRDLAAAGLVLPTAVGLLAPDGRL
jgi:hypothetical protein